MKFFSTILAILMLALSVMPCDDISGADDCNKESHLHAQKSHDHGDHEGSDDCSPFCVCQCCHTPIVTSNNPANTSSIMNLSQKNYGLYKSITTGNIVYSVWHPPKFA